MATQSPYSSFICSKSKSIRTNLEQRKEPNFKDAGVSEAAMDLMSKLMEQDPDRRLDYATMSLDEVRREREKKRTKARTTKSASYNMLLLCFEDARTEPSLFISPLPLSLRHPRPSPPFTCKNRNSPEQTYAVGTVCLVFLPCS